MRAKWISIGWCSARLKDIKVEDLPELKPDGRFKDPEEGLRKKQEAFVKELDNGDVPFYSEITAMAIQASSEKEPTFFTSSSAALQHLEPLCEFSPEDGSLLTTIVGFDVRSGMRLAVIDSLRRPRESRGPVSKGLWFGHRPTMIDPVGDVVSAEKTNIVSFVTQCTSCKKIAYPFHVDAIADCSAAWQIARDFGLLP